MLHGSELILHAGDIGTPEVLTTLGMIAPVIAVCGNNDRGAWAQTLPERELIRVGAASIYLLHDVKELDLDPASENVQMVVSGHSHQPMVQERAGVLYVNPGSAGPKRFKLPVTVARLYIKGAEVSAEIIELAVSAQDGAWCPPRAH